MKRRDFLKKTILFALLGAGGSPVLRPWNAFGQPDKNDAIPDLVAVMGGEPDRMFDEGIKALGGIKRFVKPNQVVVVKPNIGWDTEPERGGDTNPILVKQIVNQALSAGAKSVYVFDHTCDVWEKCYENSGIQFQVKQIGGKMVPANTKNYYQAVNIPNGKKLKSAMAHELFLSADVIINVPVLKHHGGAQLTMSMKNLMGVVWDRRWWHRNDLHQCIADFSTFRKPDLVVIDAYRIMKQHGPMGVSVNDVALQKAQILSTDPVAADAAAAKLFGRNPGEINYISYANALGVGQMDLSKLLVKKIKV